jgi:hypothetical protein
MWPMGREGVVVASLLLLLAAGPAQHLAQEEEEEGVVAPEHEGYIRAGDLFYRTEWKPRDCIGRTHFVHIYI